MPEAPIRKIQLMSNRTTGVPIFYCHSEDMDHDPKISVETNGVHVALFARRTLYKVKYNPQLKDRVDMYMSISQANVLGTLLYDAAGVVQPTPWRQSTA